MTDQEKEKKLIDKIKKKFGKLITVFEEWEKKAYQQQQEEKVAGCLGVETPLDKKQ